MTAKGVLLSIGASIAEIPCVVLLAVWSLITRLFHNGYSNHKPKIFMGSMHINNWVYVASALREYGYDVRLVVWNPPLHEVNVVPYDIVLSKRYVRIFRSHLLKYFFQYAFFFWAIWSFDVFIMCFSGRLIDRSFFARWVELPLFKLAGKKVILNTYGADIMTPRMTLAGKYKYSVLQGYLADPLYASLNEARIARNRAYCERWADKIVSAIDHVEYLNRVDEYLHMRCINISRYQIARMLHNSTPVILHAPNHRMLKGTEYLISAVDELKRDGFSVELRVLEKCAHHQVMDAIATCDIVADQFLVGAYARLAIEAMAFAKPVLCYLREDLFQYNPIWRECPIVNANPDTLKEKIKELLLMSPDERAEIGHQGRSYVDCYHSLGYVGGRLDKIIKNLGAMNET